MKKNDQVKQKVLVKRADDLGIVPYKAHKEDSKKRSSSFWDAYFKLKAKSKPADQELERIISDEVNRLKKLVS